MNEPQAVVPSPVITHMPVVRHGPQDVVQPARNKTLQQPGLRRESLPFVVRTVSDDESLLRAVSLRAAAYGRHVPEYAHQLHAPEPADRAASSRILIAESKLDRLALGTMRIQTNLLGPLALERSFELPDFLRGRRLAEATRLGVVQETQGRLVRTMLFKAFFLHCVEQGIDWMVITARRPLDRIYEGLQFTDVRPEAGFVPMQHVGGLPHRVMAMQVGTAQTNWKASAHPLYDFMFTTYHPDLLS